MIKQDFYIANLIARYLSEEITPEETIKLTVNPEKPDVPLNKNDAFQKVQKRHVQEKR